MTGTLLQAQCPECRGTGRVRCSHGCDMGTCECITCGAPHDCGGCQGFGTVPCPECAKPEEATP